MTGAPEIAAAINAVEPVEFDQPPIELKEAGLSQRDALLQVSDKAEIWRSPDGETHASVPVGDHFEYHRLNSRSFRDWMLGEVARSYLNNGRPASVGETSMRDARLALEAQAYLNGVQQEAPLRTAAHGDAIYIDRGTSDRSVFGITSAGWKVEPRSPVPILRSKRAAAFAEPIAPGSFTPLRHLLGHLDDGQFVLFVSWCLWALSPTGPYPILIVTGEAGSGKSTLVRLAQRLVDPVTGDLLQPPDNDRDLIAAARHGRALSFDNISRLRPELADSLCRLATGSEIGGRSLYTDHDTATFAACRPLILNGIPDLAARGDLAGPINRDQADGTSVASDRAGMES